MEWIYIVTYGAAIIHYMIVIGLFIRIIMKRPGPGIALAWMLLISALPVGGIVLYMMFGEHRLSELRLREIGTVTKEFRNASTVLDQEGLTNINWSNKPNVCQFMNKLGLNTVGSPAVHGSSYELFSDTEEMLLKIAADIDAAKESVLIEFYIWNKGGAADKVLEALIRAAGRGVSCRVLIDALGARPWWKSKQPAQLRKAGVQLRQALPVGLLHSIFSRTDLRLHRKIVVIDGQTAWTGSMNLVDPRFFKQDSGCGEWVDALVRLKGSAVALLGATMLTDWAIETRESVPDLLVETRLHKVSPVEGIDLQVIPSGPGMSSDAMLLIMIELINAAEEELILTTPYLVPDESLLRSLRGTAARGVNVTIVLPEKVDSLLTRFASRSYYDELIQLGVQLKLFRGGLLHTKSVVADGKMSMFGTVNLDMRSLWLNYEVALFVYDDSFSGDLRNLLQGYIEQSIALDPEAWAQRPFLHRLMENTMRMFSPLL